MRRNRLSPRIWDTDWLVLRGLRKILTAQISRYVKPDHLMVDLGCGDMPYRELALQGGIHYIGADIGSAADIQIQPDGRVPLDTASADAVISIQVLEHVPSLNRYCSEIRRILKDDGVLILSTHGSWLYHPHPEDHRRWTRSGLVLDLTEQGLDVEEIVPIVGPLATTTLIRLTGYAYVLRKLPLIGGAVSALLAVVMNTRSVIEDMITPETLIDNNACVYLVRAKKAAA